MPSAVAPSETAQKRRLVASLAATGVSHEQIAAEVGVTVDELSERFERELKHGRDKAIAANIKRLEAAADAGNVAAMKALDVIYRANKSDPIHPVAKKVAPLGKKEQANADAQTAAVGTSWEAALNKRLTN